MKKGLKFLLVILALVLITGCNKDNKVIDDNKDNKDNKDNIVDDNKENVVDDNKETKKDDNKENVVSDKNNLIIKNPGIKLGEEVYNIKLNNKNKKLRVEYNNYPKSEIDLDDKYGYYYITYTVYLDNVKIYDNQISWNFYNELDDIKKLASADKTFKLDYSAGIKTHIIKGTDNKEYLLIRKELYGEIYYADKLVIVNDMGKKLGDLSITKDTSFTITGKNSSKYKEYWYYYYTNNKLFYINPTEAMCKNNELDYLNSVIDFDEYEITINNDKIISKKTGDTYKGTDIAGASPVDCEIVTLTIK